MTRSTSAGRSRMDLGQQLSRFGPDGLDMTCREHWIRELDIVGMPGRMAIEWAALAKVHSDQPYHSGQGWWSGGNCLRRWTG